MGIFAAIGFEGGSTKYVGEALSGASVISTSGLNMDGDYCLECHDANDFLKLPITAADEIYFSFRYRPIGIISGLNAIAFFSDTTKLASVGVLTNLRGRVGSTTVETAAFAMANDTTYIVSGYFKIADSGGRIVVKQNGITAIDYTGDTKPGAETTFNTLAFGYTGTSFEYGYAYFDNIILSDSAYIVGAPKIRLLQVSAAGDATNWTPSTGDNYACVDEVPDSATDNITTNAADILDNYTHAGMPEVPSSILGVCVSAVAIAEGSPTPTNAKLNLKSGSTDYFSSDIAVPSAEGRIYNFWDVDPDTSAAFTYSGVNSTLIGIKSAV